MTDSLRPRERVALSIPAPISGIGMSPAEIDKFSVMRAISEMAGTKRKDYTLEQECSQEVAKLFGKEHDGKKMFLPPEILQRRNIPATICRDLNTAVPGTGGFLTDRRNVSFIDLLRVRTVVLRMGATLIPNMRSGADIPKQTGGANAVWLINEVTAPPESQAAFGQLPLSPKTVSAYTELSRLTVKMSNSEAVVMADLAASTAVAMDAAAISGSGANGEPSGVLSSTGVGAAAGASLGYASLLECQTDTLTANALVNLDTVGYVAPTAVASLLMQRVKFAGTDSPLWAGNMANGSVIGFPAISTQQIPAETLVFGDWSQLVVAEWGVLAVEVNPFANFRAGIVGVRGLYTVDIGLRHPASFCAITGVT